MARGNNFRKLLPWLVMNDEPFLRRYGDYLRPYELSGGDDDLEWLLKFALDFWTKYKKVPSYDALGEAFADLPKVVFEKLDGEAIASMLDIETPDEGTLAWAREHGDEYIRRRNAINVGNAIAEAVADNDLNRYVEILENSYAFSRTNSAEGEVSTEISFEFLDGLIESIFPEEGYRLGAIPVGIGEIDEIMGGGTCPGEMGCIVGATNAGKSQLLTAFARNVWLQAKSVLFISLEDDVEKINQTFLSGLFQMTPEQMNRNKEVTQKKLEAIMSKPGMKQNARFKAVYWTAGSKGVADIEMLLDKELDIRGVEYDFIFVDYGDVLKPTRVRNNGREDMEQGEIFLHLRNLAVSRNLRLWSGSQANRDALDKAMIKLSNIGNSYEKVKHPDWVVLIGQSADMARDREFNLFLRKARKGAQQTNPLTFVSRWEVNSFEEA